MTKTHRKAAVASDDSFNKHYAAIWGEERWLNSLYPALLKSTRYACLLNRYAPMGAARLAVDRPDVETVPLTLPRISRKDGVTDESEDFPPSCIVRHMTSSDPSPLSSPSDESFPMPQPSAEHPQTHWNLDAASVLVSHLLNIQHGDNVLDLCAAPGGKSIALAQNIWLHHHVDHSDAKSKALQERPRRVGTLHSNESDGPRQRRLAENLRSYLPKSLVDTSHITALRIDGTSSKAEYEFRVKTPDGTVSYDKVLVDAPCSSERHVIHANAKANASGKIADEMANWRPGSSKRLAETQLRLLMTGLRAVRVGGTVIYATCSIEPTENDCVVEKMLSQVEKERKKGALRWNVKVGFNENGGDEALEADIEENWAEKTKHGWIVLPDHPAGGRWGPLYFAVLKKCS